MKKFLTPFLLASVIQFSSAQTFNPLLSAMLQDTLDYYTSVIPSIKGMSASVYYPGQGIWQGVAGESYTGEPITTDMEFGIASNTKLFVSAVMLKLAEDGILNLDDAVHDWLPDHPNVDPDITIRQLLNHTSGVSDPIFLSPWMDTIMQNPTRVFSNEEVLSWLGAPYFAPGAGWSYSNVNYILAGMIAESATGSSISSLIRNQILTPLEMDSTFYDVEEPETGTIAHRWYNLIDYHDTSRVGLNTAGGCAGSLFSTSAEMVQWYHALFSGDIINNASLAELTDFVPTGMDYYDYGLGFSRETTLTKTYWGHSGATWGYRSKMMYDSCRGAVVCGLVNSFPAGEQSVVYLLYSVIDNHLPGCGGPVSGPVTVCAGETGITYSVPPIPHATAYAWSLPGGATGVSVTSSITVDFGPGAVSGEIIVTGVSDYGNGPANTLFVTVNPKPATPVITQTGSTLHSDAPAGNQWYNAAGPIAGATSQDYIITAEDDYYVIVTLEGCSSDASEIFHAAPLFVDPAGSDETIIIFPNPVTNELTVSSSADKGVINFNLINATGQIIISGKLEGETHILTADLNPGIYILNIFGEGVIRNALIVKL